MYFLIFVFILIFTLINASTIINLGGENIWRFYSSSNQSFSHYQLKSIIPGDIFTDLVLNGVLKKSPLYDENDLNYRWVAYEDWIYERNFTISNYLLKVYSIKSYY